MDNINSSIGIIIPLYNESPLEIVESQSLSIISNSYGDVNQHGAETGNYNRQKPQKSTCCGCLEKYDSYGTYPPDNQSPTTKETIVLQTYITEKQVFEPLLRKQNDAYDTQPRKLMNRPPSPSPNESPCCSCLQSPHENEPFKKQPAKPMKEFPNPSPNESPCSCCISNKKKGAFEKQPEQPMKELRNPSPNESPCCSCCQSPKYSYNTQPNNQPFRDNNDPNNQYFRSEKIVLNSYNTQPNNQPFRAAKEIPTPSPNESPCCSCCRSPIKEKRQYVMTKPIQPVQNKYDKPVYQYHLPEIDPISDSTFAVEQPEQKISTYVDSEVESKSIQISRTEENDKSAEFLGTRSTAMKSPTSATYLSARSPTVKSPISDAGLHSKRLLGEIGNEIVRRIFPPYTVNECKNSKTMGTNVEETKNTYDGTTIDSINHLLMECAMKLAATEGERDNYSSDNDSVKRYCQVPMKHIPKNRNENLEYNRNDPYANNKSGRNYPASAIHNDMTGNKDSYEFIKNTFNRLSDWVHHFPNTEDQAHLSCGPNSFAGQNSCFKVEVCEAPCGKETIVINKI